MADTARERERGVIARFTTYRHPRCRHVEIRLGRVGAEFWVHTNWIWQSFSYSDGAGRRIFSLSLGFFGLVLHAYPRRPA